MNEFFYEQLRELFDLQAKWESENPDTVEKILYGDPVRAPKTPEEFAARMIERNQHLLFSPGRAAWPGSLLRQALADRTLTARIVERAREATNVASARSEVMIRRLNDQDQARARSCWIPPSMTA